MNLQQTRIASAVGTLFDVFAFTVYIGAVLTGLNYLFVDQSGVAVLLVWIMIVLFVMVLVIERHRPKNSN